MKIRPASHVFLASVLFAATALAQDAIDPKLMAEIERIGAIDNHSHAEPVYAERGKGWRLDNPLGVPRYPDVMPLRRDNPDWIKAWSALYGYRYQDMEPAHLRALLETKQKLLRERGEAWPREVLDKSGIDIVLVNATRLGDGQSKERFRWVPYADPLLWPFRGEESPLRFNGGDTSNGQLLREAGLASMPASLNAYRSTLIEATLKRWASSGAVAVKFMSAYARSLDFEAIDAVTASKVYAKVAKGTVLQAPERKALEDYLFGEIAAAAGRNGLVVQIHTGNGDGPYFTNRRADPALLETMLDSKPLRKTNFVLVHGSWPYHLTAQAMIDKPNTYADFSAQTFYLTTHALAEVLRGWLGWHPEKVLFGTDAYSDVDSPLADYEEKQWLLTYRARRALAIALTAMVRDGEISQDRAIEIAHKVLHDNAATLYRIGLPRAVGAATR